MITRGYKRWRALGRLAAFAAIDAAMAEDAKTTTRAACAETFKVAALGITGERSRAVAEALRER